jgi:hypothetical protein
MRRSAIGTLPALRSGVLVANVALVLGLAACSSSGSGNSIETSAPATIASSSTVGSTTTTEPATTTTTTTVITTTTARAAAEPGTIEVLAKDYAYSGLPSTIAAGSRISLTTEAGGDPHEITFMRVKDSDTRSFEELAAAIAALPPGQLPPMLEQPFALWIFALPGETDSAIFKGDGTLPPGRYTYFDTIHVGAFFSSVRAYQAGMETQGDSPMHATLGMSGWLTVE